MKIRLRIDTRSIFTSILLALVLVAIDEPWYCWVVFAFTIIGINISR
jgi:hypothetical protein